MFASWSEAASEVNYRFFRLVHSLDLTSVTKIASTLVRSTDRDVRDFRERALKAESRCDELPNEDGEDADALHAPAPAAESESDAIEALRARLAAVVGDDAELVLGVVVYGKTQVEAGERLGLSPVAVHKRFQRATKRIREAGLSTFEGVDPHFTGESAKWRSERKSE